MLKKVLLIGLLAPVPLFADGIISTFAGAGVVDGVLASSTVLGNPQGMVLDGVGNIYLADTQNNRIRRIDGGTGIITTLAGTGLAGYSGDYGPASSAELSGPTALTIYSPSGFGAVPYLYVADVGNNRIRRINLATGVIDTAAGNGISGYNGDGGPAIYASLNQPEGVCVTPDGGTLYISDTNNERIREVTLFNGNITTSAGTGSCCGSGDGASALLATFNQPRGLALSPSGNLYIADTGDNRVREVLSPSTPGIVTSVAGTGGSGYSGDNGPALSATFRTIYDVFVDVTGNVFVTDSGNNNVRRVNASNQSITTVVGTGVAGYTGDNGPALAARLSRPYAGKVDLDGNLFIVDGNNCVRRVSGTSKVITTIAGNGNQENVPANTIAMTLPISVASSPGGDIYIADVQDCRVRKVNAGNGLISTFAGTGVTFSAGDGGPANLAGVPDPVGLAVAADGTVYVSQEFPSVIRSVDTLGNITRVAGSGTTAYGVGPALTTPIIIPFGICLSGSSLYMTETDAFVVTRLDLVAKTISLVAGTPSSSGYQDGPALSAKFGEVYGLAADSQGNLYVADGSNNAIRKISMGVSPTVSTICGLGPTHGGYKGDGAAAVNAALNFPVGLYMDASNNLYVTDASNQRIRRIDAVTGIISTVAGSGLAGYAGDGGPSLSARFNFPVSVVIDPSGSLVIADYQNNVVRKVSYATSPVPTPVVSGVNKVVAYPSPANNRICFSYQAPQSGPATIKVYNVALQLVATLQDSALGGTANLTCADVSGLASGVYLYKLETPGGSFAVNKFKVAR
jgi:sugar lactone lactonase YvrE